MRPASRHRSPFVTSAHAGVLFLDEFPLFRTDVIDALREPLESGEVTVSRTEESVTLPAGAMVVVASNPCPCGRFHVSPALDRCECTEVRRRRYRSRIAGPVTDRIDITRHVEPLRRGDHDPFTETETSAQVRVRVAAARERQAARYAAERWRLNGQATGPGLVQRHPLADDAARDLLSEAVLSGRLSNRGATRVHRVAWTVADLASVRAGVDVVPGVHEVEVALRLRTGESLPSAAVRPRAGRR
ncbi:ATP-binding protein [Nocardioides lentus]|uniref:ATP-binding protein n=1 Tax=Nocardioides lentus TaxID=338077 RepID=UPI0031DFE1E2